jgi:hypothetical protein
MPAQLHHRDGTELALPTLSDDAVVQIHSFIEQVLALFESRYADQIRSFYDGMREDNIINGSDRHNVDDPPF